MAALPERKRTFLTLKLAGYSHDEIGEQLGVSWLTVNSSSRPAPRFGTRTGIQQPADSRIRTS